MMKKKWLIIPAVCLLIICAIKAFIYTGDDAWNELLALDSTVTMEDLTKKGYIDVSEVMSSQNKDISSFFAKASNGYNAVLRIVNIVDGKLCVKILVYELGNNVIKMWTVYPNQQQAENLGKCFSLEVYEEEADGVVNVFLKHVSDVSRPSSGNEILIDEILYSYSDSKK